MPGPNEILPEGTDAIINGAAVTGIDDPLLASTGAFGASSAGSEDYPGNASSTDTTSTKDAAKAKITEAASGLRGQAADKAREYASQGKDMATEKLDGIARLVSDAAAQVDERVGEQYGAYARQAADAVSSFAETLRRKDVDELFDDARSAVRKSPAIAIGAAAAVGFVLARLAKAGTASVDQSNPGSSGGTSSAYTPAADSPSTSGATGAAYTPVTGSYGTPPASPGTSAPSSPSTGTPTSTPPVV